MKKVINTYYMPVEGLTTLDERKLLGIWFDEWQRDGWEPVILNEHHARGFKKFAEYERKISTFDSVNPAQYERANHLRWAALATVGGFASDFDLLPTGKDWEMNRNKPRIPTVFQDSHEGGGNACPSLVWATEQGYAAYIDFVLSLKDGHVSDKFGERNHTSDMFLWRDYIKTGAAQIDSQVFQYGQEGWQNAALIHFSRASTHGQGISPRWKHVPILLAETRRSAQSTRV